MVIKTFISLVSILVFAGCSTVSAEQSKVQSLESEGGVYSFESDASGFNTKTYFYDNGEQVVVFDTQFTEEIAEKFVDFIKSKTSNPITHVVLTHPNPDKFNGLSVFKKLGAEVVASEKTAEAMPGVHEYKNYYFVNIAKMFTEETYPRLETVDITFADTSELKLQNGEEIKLRELSEAGVSSNQTVAYIPKVNALIVGDLVHHKAHAWLEGGIVSSQPMPTLNGWIDDLRELERFYGNQNPTVFGGRGKIVKLRVSLPEQISYLRKADKLVADYVATVSDISELQGGEAQSHYKSIQFQFEKMFPDYSLPYMITYGVYGLVNQKLRNVQ